MKVVRYQDSAVAIHLGRLHEGGQVTRLEGDLFGTLRDTEQPADVHKQLAPLVPTDIICIGLNYRKHAEEGESPCRNSRSSS